MLDFDSDPRILRGSYRASLDSRTMVGGLALSGDETRLLSWGHNAVRLWDTRSETLLNEWWATWNFQTHITAAYSDDSATIVSSNGSDITVETIGDETANTGLVLLRNAYPLELALSPSGRLLAVFSSVRDLQASLCVYEATSGALLQSWLLTDTNHLAHLTFAPDEATLAALDPSSGTIIVWQLGAGEISRVAVQGDISGVTLSPDAQLAATSSHGQVRLLELASGRTLHTFSGLEGWVNALTFSEDGTELAGVSWGGDVAVWEVATGRLLHTLRADEGLSAVALGGTRLTTGSQSGALTLLELPSLTVRETMSHGEQLDASLELTPTYFSRSRYEVEGTATIKGQTLRVRGVVEGHESQAYDRRLTSQARPPLPASFTAQLLDGEVPQWYVEAFTHPWSDDRSWHGGLQHADPPRTMYSLTLERD